MTQPTHIEPADLGEADRTLKTKHRAMWASGNYPAVVTDIVAELVRSWFARPGSPQVIWCWMWGRAAAMRRFRQLAPVRRSSPPSHARAAGGRSEVGRPGRGRVDLGDRGRRGSTVWRRGI